MMMSVLQAGEMLGAYRVADTAGESILGHLQVLAMLEALLMSQALNNGCDVGVMDATVAG